MGFASLIHMMAGSQGFQSAGYLEIIRGLAMPHVSFVLFNLNNGMVPRTLLRLGESCHGTLLESEKMRFCRHRNQKIQQKKD